jgi:polar amino acid transport system substrate-binding protein
LTAYPPHGYVEDGQAKGVDGELIALIAEMECLELDVKDADAAGIPDQIKTGRADVSGGDWWRSTSRVEVIDMTIPIYLDGMAVVSRDGLNTVDALEGKTIGDLQGNYWNADAKKAWGDNYKLYKSIDQVFKDLKIGRLDAAIATPGSGAYYVDQEGLTGYRVEVLQPDPLFPASQKPPQAGLMTSLDNPELTAAFNENLQELIDNGTVAALLEKYGFPASAGETGEPYFV